MLNLCSKFQGFMTMHFKDILIFNSHFPSVLVWCITSLAEAVKSQAEDWGPLKRVFIVIMPQYLFEINGFRIYSVHLIKDICNITDKLGFWISACDITGSFTGPLTRKEWREEFSYYWFCLSMNIKYRNKTYFAGIRTYHRVP